jgi:RNA polymerase sigma-54 factor
MDSNFRLYQSTSLTITPQLQQAIHLLQLSYQELETFLQNNIEENPFLTMGIDGPEEEAPLTSQHTLEGGGLSFESTIPGGKGIDLKDMPESLVPANELTLHEHLMQQVGSQITSQLSRLIAGHLVQFIQPTGYFEGNLESIAHHLGCSLIDVENVLKQMQRFDPSGVCACNLKDCLKTQLQDRGLLTPDYHVLLDNLDLVAKGEIALLARKTRLSEEILRKMFQEIRRLSPKPGLVFQRENFHAMIPEVLMHWDAAESTWIVSLNPETIPKVLLDKSYYSHVRSHLKESKDRQYLSTQMSHANWLIKALNQRSTTLLKVSTEIVRQQENFFNGGIRHLKPLILRDIAVILQIHESTISRVTTGKFIATPRGTFELKYFFSSGIDKEGGLAISSEYVRHLIQNLIQSEPLKAPLCDDAIALYLCKEGVTIARRTVAKYREALGIPPAFQRRRWKALQRFKES